MKTWIFIGLLMISFFGHAQEIGSSCPDLSVTSIKSKDKLLKVFSSLKSAVAAKDVVNISKAVIYPLRVNSNPKRKPIRNEAELVKEFSSVFTVDILKAIQSQKFEDLFCRDQGVMIGDGEVWINERNGKIGIETVNL